MTNKDTNTLIPLFTISSFLISISFIMMLLFACLIDPSSWWKAVGLGVLTVTQITTLICLRLEKSKRLKNRLDKIC